jgi:hypothetical protein
VDPDLLVGGMHRIFCYQLILVVLSKDQIKYNPLLSNQTTNNYWTSAWSLYLSDTLILLTKKIVVKTRLKSLLVTLTQLCRIPINVTLNMKEEVL